MPNGSKAVPGWDEKTKRPDAVRNNNPYFSAMFSPVESCEDRFNSRPVSGR